MHYCNMSGLATAAVYKYSFGDLAVGMSEAFTFRSAPAVGTLAPQRVVVYGAISYGSDSSLPLPLPCVLYHAQCCKLE